MIKKIFIILLALLISQPAFAMRTVLISGEGGTTLNTSGTSYIPLWAGTEAHGTTETQKQVIIPIAGRIEQLNVHLMNSTAYAEEQPQNGAGTQSWIGQLRIRG